MGIHDRITRDRAGMNSCRMAAAVGVIDLPGISIDMLLKHDTWWRRTATIPGAGADRGNRNQLAASHRDLMGEPKTRTAAPQPQNWRAGHPVGWLTMDAVCWTSGTL